MEKMTIEVKKLDLVKIWRSSTKVEGSIGGSVEFKFGMSVNRATLKPMIEAIDSLQTPSEKITEYLGKYHALLKGYEDKKLTPEEAQKSFDGDILTLNEEYKDAIQERNAQLQEFEQFLNDTITVDLYPVTVEDLLSAFKAVDQRKVTQEDFTNMMLLVK